MRILTVRTEDGEKRWRFSPGIRSKLFVFLLPLVFLLVVSVAAAVTRITEGTIRKDLLMRGVAVSRVVALSAGYSLLSGDRLALDTLASETKNSSPDIEYVAIRDTSDVILAHSRIEERGKKFRNGNGAPLLGTFLETRATETVDGGRHIVEFTTPILFSGKRVGTASLGISKGSLTAAQKGLRRSITLTASVLLGLAFVGTLLLASLITTPVKRLSHGIDELTKGAASFHPIPARSRDELGRLTRNFNKMAETILAQQNRLSRYAQELEEAYVGMVRVIAASIDARDPYTLGHSTRVARLSCELGRRLGFSEEEIMHLEKACLFHDVGKIRTPDDILLKQYSLTQPEAEEMRTHPADGAEILRMAPSLHRNIAVVRSHHEWYNGDGYPDGKKESEIPVHAQIIALADAYDAMTSTRPYRKGLTPEEAVDELLRYRGTQFSPDLTDAFVRMIRELPVQEPGEWKGMAL